MELEKLMTSLPSLQWIAIEALKPNPRNARTHAKRQIRQIGDSIKAFGFVVPIGGKAIRRGATSILLRLRESLPLPQ